MQQVAGQSGATLADGSAHGGPSAGGAMPGRRSRSFWCQPQQELRRRADFETGLPLISLPD